MTEILHEVPEQRFVTQAEGHAARLDYIEDEGRLTITHTIVPPEIGGRGIAGELVRAALAYARDAGLKVDPQCSYADAWMRRHPEFDVLRA
ncbi:GNAT family N-acetyltransferase [Thermomonas sp. XSG]|jgi:predicted GNAT family acetyltransferase|uniref:GNAT family N-acetyltransferase n=1 Tax=Thermomonas sp. XSG TaxID=2771436 RepID=UPI001681971E|nr:GNAT family N-acetyltransferase [Thermomonas sp. XSG]QNU14253.1 N-acetyltransferase [Thermomonas sp. XSG]